MSSPRRYAAIVIGPGDPYPVYNPESDPKTMSCARNAPPSRELSNTSADPKNVFIPEIVCVPELNTPPNPPSATEREKVVPTSVAPCAFEGYVPIGASVTIPVEPELPELPLDPLDPLEPELPEVPLEPEVPELPEVPLDPEDPEEPLLPEEPDVPYAPPGSNVKVTSIPSVRVPLCVM